MLSESEFTATVVEKAKSLGASVAGVADVEPLKASPSHRIHPKIGMDPEVRWQQAPAEALHYDEAVPAMPVDREPRYGVKYCRACELSCPVGRRMGAQGPGRRLSQDVGEQESRHA